MSRLNLESDKDLEYYSKLYRKELDEENKLSDETIVSDIKRKQEEYKNLDRKKYDCRSCGTKDKDNFIKKRYSECKECRSKSSMESRNKKKNPHLETSIVSYVPPSFGVQLNWTLYPHLNFEFEDKIE
jgi:predicted Zn-ribbon and HTH transcriptional regulator